MEKRISAVIRWMERCKEAWRSGSPESALMDAECAGSDLENLRNDLWNHLKDKHTLPCTSVRPLLRFSVNCCKTLLLTATLVLAVASPLAPTGYVAEIRDYGSEEAAVLEWVTPDEKVLLGNLRKSLSDANTARTRENQAIPSPSVASIKKQHLRALKTEKEISAPDEQPIARNNDKIIPYDRIIGLLKKGEQALKNESPVITVNRR